MSMSRNTAKTEKRELHAGGLDAAGAAMQDAAEIWAGGAEEVAAVGLQKMRTALQNADEAVRDNPWAAVGLFAFVGVIAGYMLSRRS